MRSKKSTPRVTSPHQSRPGSSQLASTTGAIAAPAPTRPLLAAMTPDEASAWLASLHDRLHKKMARERAYLNRRAARGTHTPTDDAYEDDQQLEAELLDLLEQCAQSLYAKHRQEKG